MSAANLSSVLPEVLFTVWTREAIADLLTNLSLSEVLPMKKPDAGSVSPEAGTGLTQNEPLCYALYTGVPRIAAPSIWIASAPPVGDVGPLAMRSAIWAGVGTCPP